MNRNCAVQRDNIRHSSSGSFPKTMFGLPVARSGPTPCFQDDELEYCRGHSTEQLELVLPFSEQLSLEGTPDRPVRDSRKRGAVRQETDNKRVCLDCEPLPSELGAFQDIATATSTAQQVAISLTDLPNELLQMLYGYVQKTVDVVHLSMTCKPLNKVLSPRIMTDAFIRSKAVWSTDFGLSQQQRLRQLTLRAWNRYMAEEHQLALKLRGPPLEEVTDDEDIVMTDPVDTQDTQVSHSETEHKMAMASGKWRYEVCTPTKLVINPFYGKFIQQCPLFSPALDEAARWVNNGPLVSHTDVKSERTLVSYMQKLHTSARIMVCNQTDCSNPLAIIPETLWRTPEFPPVVNNAIHPPVHLSNMMQIMSMKFYPQQRNQGKMRVLIVIAFGRGSYNPPPNAGIAAVDNNGAQDTDLLDIWEVIKVIEIYIADTPRIPGAVLEPPTPGRTEIIVLNSHQDALRGRIIEIYNTPAASEPSSVSQPEPVMEDRIALIGLRQYSERGNANVILMKCQLFLNSSTVASGTSSHARSKWVCHVLATHGLAGLEATCMTLFPSRSPLERLVAILDRTGRGEIWDWINVRRVSMLSLAEVQGTVSGTASSTTATATTTRPVHSLLIPRKCSDGTPYTPLQLLSQTHHHLQQRKNKRQGLHYWGIHASFAMELMAHGEDEAPDLNYGDIRLVAMADGTDRQSEISWWHIDQEKMSKHLQSITDLAAANSLLASATTTRPGNIRRIPPLEIRSSGRHFEYQTLSRTITFRPDGQSFRREIGKTVKPLQTNAFLVWENYRIILSVDNGLSIVDMDQETTGDILPPLKITSAKEKEFHASNSTTSSSTASAAEASRRGPHVLEEDILPTVWVTLLDNAEEDPISDISTVDDCLLVTRKYSHLLWPFRELVSKFLSSSPSPSWPVPHQVMDNKILLKTH